MNTPMPWIEDDAVLLRLITIPPVPPPPPAR